MCFYHKGTYVLIHPQIQKRGKRFGAPCCSPPLRHHQKARPLFVALANVPSSVAPLFRVVTCELQLSQQLKVMWLFNLPSRVFRAGSAKLYFCFSPRKSYFQ